MGLRVLQVNTYHFRGGGDSSYTFNLADMLRARGHQVAFFAMRDERNLPDPNEDLFVDNIDFRDLNSRKGVATGVTVLRRAVYSSEARRRFARLLDRFQPEIVHLQNIHGHITPSVLFEARQRSLPVVWTLHDYKMICPNTHFLVDRTGEICEACGRSRYYQAVLRRCKKGSLLASAMAAMEAYAHRLMRVRSRVNAFLAPSAFLRARLIERGFPTERVVHLPHFVPPGMFRDSGLDDGYVLFFGKLRPIKGIAPLLQAAALAPEVPLILAGRLAESLVHDLPGMLSPNVQYVGMKDGQELAHLVDRARAVVVPSLCYENQPLSVLEAFAAGKPVIVSDVGGMTELVTHEERGLLVPRGDVSALTAGLRWMMAHPADAREMGRIAQRYAMENHSADAHYEKLKRVYEQVGAAATDASPVLDQAAGQG